MESYGHKNPKGIGANTLCMQVAFISSISGIPQGTCKNELKESALIWTRAVWHLTWDFARRRHENASRTLQIKMYPEAAAAPTGRRKINFTSTHKWRRLIALACVGLDACRNQNEPQDQLMEKMRGACCGIWPSLFQCCAPGRARGETCVMKATPTMATQRARGARGLGQVPGSTL